MAKDWPLLVVALVVWAYWGTVLLLVLYKRLRHGQRSGLVPRDRREKRLWYGIVPVVSAWNVLPTLAFLFPASPFGVPAWATETAAVYLLRAVVAGLAVACYLATLACWLHMGRNWGMAIVPGQKTDLVTTGLFGWVRHPIYSLSILLMVCTALVATTVPMLVVACVHVVLMNLKASREEEHLGRTHGPAYADYCRRVGRFVPRLSLAR